MSLFFRAMQSSIASRSGLKLFFPVLVKFGKAVGTRRIARDLAILTSLSEGDAYNVLVNLSTVMYPHLLNSRSVYLEGLGTFTIKATSSGNGVETAEEVSADQINYLRVQFTPEYTRPKGVGKTRSQFLDVEYVRWDGSKQLPDDDSGSSGGSGDPNA